MVAVSLPWYRQAVSWPLVAPPVIFLILLAEIGGHLSPVPIDLSLWLFTAAAGLLLLKLGVWVVTRYRTFGREQRLLAVVSFLAIASSWYASRLWLFQRQFDALVATQNTNLKLTLNELSGKILVFAADRGRHAPPAPRPESWDRDEAELMRYRQATEIEFEATFGTEVRAAHDVLSLYRLTDRDFERFYRQPADTFEMKVVAAKLVFFAGKIPL